MAQQPTTYLDIGGVFPLLTTTGDVDPAGVQRQAGKFTMYFILFALVFRNLTFLLVLFIFRFYHGGE